MGMGMSLKHLGFVIVATWVTWAYGDNTSNWWPFTAWLFVIAIGYYISLRLHPVRNCWKCRGSGKHVGMIWDYARRPCESCGGRAWQPRWGVRLLGLPTEAWLGGKAPWSRPRR
jgi:hypothetical protein